MKRGLAALLIAIFAGLGLFSVIVLAVYVTLPDVTVLKGCLTTNLHRVYLCENSSNYVPLDRISPYLVGAVIMSEDASFNYHQGIDLEEMRQSFIHDIKMGRFARGASTITQQLAKNVFLSSEKSLTRKVKEIYLAKQIEKHFTKSKIMSLYLNVVEFGRDIYGVKAAAQHYFQKSAMDLNPEEAAFLAFLLPNPKKYAQSFERKALTPFANQMVRRILRKMLLGKKIDEGTYAAAVARVNFFPWNGTVTETTEADLRASQQEELATDEANQEDNYFQFDSTYEDPEY